MLSGNQLTRIGIGGAVRAYGVITDKAASEVIISEGLEYRHKTNRLHYRHAKNKLHYRHDGNRLHYRAKKQ